MSNPLKIKVAYMYPDILHSFCDYANVDVFKFRASYRNIEVSVSEIKKNEKIQSSKYDFFYIGGSNIESLNEVMESFKKNRDELSMASALGIPILGVNCGYQILGNYVQLHNQNQIDGLGILDVDSIATNYEYCNDVVGNCEFLEGKTIAGNENHSSITYLKSGVTPFITVSKGFGNNGKDKTEGARFNNTFGTYIISPIFAQNPHFCDFIISQVLNFKYKCRIPLSELCDDIEWFSHNDIVGKK